MNKLTNYRKQIDLIDQQLVKLIGKRMTVVKKVGIWKKQNHIPPLDQLRWEKVINSKIRLAKKYKINQNMVKEIYNIIHRFALEIEK